MESSSSGGALARRRSSGGGSFSGDAGPFDIPAKGASLERLSKWRVSTLLHARHFVVASAFRRRDVSLCTVRVSALVWAHLIVVGFEL
jgi:hypothetical protein